ncbi:MAG: hypothetical protein ACRYHA_19035 [Janthinobacterium lividum]
MESTLESIYNTDFYHGSMTENIKSFNIFSHFGSLDAALAAASVKYQLLDSKRDKTGFLYKVRLNPSKTRIEKVDDFGNPNPLSVLAALAELGDKVHVFKGLEEARRQAVEHKGKGRRGIESLGIADTTEKYTKEALDMATKAIAEVRYGVRNNAASADVVNALAYENNIEGEDGALSICVLDPSIITLIEVVKLTQKQLEDAWSLVSEERRKTLS